MHMPALQLIAVAGMLCSFLLMVSDESVVEMMRSRDGKVGASATNKECDHQAYAKPASTLYLQELKPSHKPMEIKTGEAAFNTPHV